MSPSSACFSQMQRTAPTYYLTVEQVAKRLHLSTRAVHERTRLAKIPHRRIGGTRRCLFVPEELDAWLNGAELEVVELARGLAPPSYGEGC
jgi:excisionase family DNA binding protein